MTPVRHTLDHVVVAVHDLDQAVFDYRALGFTVVSGGTHANGATHNALIIFEDGTYIELLARTNQSPASGLIDFSLMLDGDEGLVGYALGTDDIEADAVRLRTNGITVGEIIPGERRRPDGALIQWKLLQIDPDGESHGFAPFFIQDVTPRALRVPVDPALFAHDNRAVGIGEVDVVVRDFDASLAPYQTILGDFPRGFGTNHVIIKLPSGGITLYQPTPPSDETWEAYRHRLFPNQVQPTEADLAASEQLRILIEAKERSRQQWQRDREAEALRWARLSTRAEALYRINLLRDADPDGRFSLDKTHNLRIHQVPGVSQLQEGGLFAGLDAVDWGSLTHAYGAATDVPKWLRMLTSESGFVREAAYDDLYRSLLHQGTVYPATLAVIPFLLRLLDTPGVPERFGLFDFLISASGHRGDNKHDNTRDTDPDTEHDDAAPDPSADHQLNRGLRLAFVMGLETYADLLIDDDPAIRRAAAQAVALCGESPTAESAIRARLPDERDPEVRTALVDALYQLWTREGRQTLSEAQTAELETFRRMDESPAAQFSAALALARSGEIEAALPTFYSVFSADIDPLRAYRSRSVMMIFLDGIDALVAARQPRAAFDWAAAGAAHADPLVRKDVAYPLQQLAHSWRPAAVLALPVLRGLLNDPDADVRLSALAPLWELSGGSEREALRHIEKHDPLPSLRQMASQTLSRTPLDMPPKIERQRLRLPLDELIERLTAALESSANVHSAQRGAMPDLLYTLAQMGKRASAALPLVIRAAHERDRIGWTLLEALRAWRRLAPHDGEAITAAVLRGLYPIPATVYMIDLLGEIGGRASAALPTLRTIATAEWRGEGFLGSVRGVEIALDNALQAASLRAVAKIEKR